MGRERTMTYFLRMTNRIPGKNLEGAISFLNSLGWNLTMNDDQNKWYLYGGDQMIFSGDSEENIEIFILGMALSLAVLPGDFHDRIRTLIGE